VVDVAPRLATKQVADATVVASQSLRKKPPATTTMNAQHHKLPTMHLAHSNATSLSPHQHITCIITSSSPAHVAKGAVADVVPRLVIKQVADASQTEYPGQSL
jgi:hypothetical protein